jgi:hypothetical protein
MDIARRIVLIFCTICFGISILGLALSYSLSSTFATPTKLTAWLDQSVSYEQVIQNVTTSIPQSVDVTFADHTSTITISSVQIQQALKAAYPKNEFYGNLNQFIVSNFRWLQHKTSIPQFSLSLTSAEERFSRTIINEVIPNLNQLPGCSLEQLFTLGTSFNIQSAICLPPGITATTIDTKLNQQITNSTALKHYQTINAASLRNGHEPYYRKLANAPRDYHILMLLPWICGIASLLFLIGITLCARKRRGIGCIASMFLLVGALLLLVRFSSESLTSRLRAMVSSNFAANQAKQGLISAVKTAIQTVTKVDLRFGEIYVLIAILLIAVTVLLYRRQPKEVIQPKDAADPDERE